MDVIQEHKQHLADLRRSSSATVEDIRMSQTIIEQSHELLKRVDEQIERLRLN
jgi:hypothetical protein